MRATELPLAATVNPTLPFPVPLEPPAIVIHDVPLDAVHEQPVGAVTLAVLDSPDAGDVSLVGVSEYVQPAAAWVIVKVCPAIVIVPLRPVATVLAATL